MKDILTNTNYDLVIAQGDFFIGESAAQHVEFLFLSKQGEWKESPLTAGLLQSFISYFKLLFLHSNKM